MACPHCTNHCKRTIVKFSNGSSWVTNNRCERGELVDADEETILKSKKKSVANMFKEREALLLKDYPVTPVANKRGETIGLPRVLSYWETLPFWKTFFKALGFDVKVSGASTRAMYER